MVGPNTMPETDAPEPAESPPVEPAAAAPAEPAPEDWAKRFTYLYADFENYRRRTERERESLRHRSQADLLRALLPILEATEQAVEAVQRLPPTDPVRKGVEMLQKSFSNFLAEQGVGVVARPGDPFRPEEHEAVGETAATPEAADGSIAAVVQQGYAFPGGLLRPAKVVVSRRRAPAPAPTELAETEPTDGDPDGLPFVR